MELTHPVYTQGTPYSASSAIDKIKERHAFYGPQKHVAFVGLSYQLPADINLEEALNEIRAAFPDHTIEEKYSDWFLCRPAA